MTAEVEDREHKKLEKLEEIYHQYELAIIFLLSAPTYELILFSSFLIISLFPDLDIKIYDSAVRAHETTVDYYIYPVTLTLAMISFLIIKYFKKFNENTIENMNFSDSMSKEEKSFFDFLNKTKKD